MTTREKVLSYLGTHNVMTLATRGPAGPWAAAVFYANRDFTLYFLSSPDSRHARDLARDPRVAAAIHEDYRDWREIQGIQLSGRVERLEGTAREAALGCYRAKFAFLDSPSAEMAPVLAALEKVACYQLTPSEAHFVDNPAGFGLRARVPLEVE
jgi:uncharacterized protein YhbP (UPF0306 family)